MSDFTREPVRFRPMTVVEAMQWDGTAEGAQAIAAWAREENEHTTWVAYSHDPLSGTVTVGGHLHLSYGDWLVRDPSQGLLRVSSLRFSSAYAQVKEARL